MSAAPVKPPGWLLLVGTAWLVCYLGYFFSLDLPAAKVPRALLVQELPWLLLDIADPPAPEPGDLNELRLQQHSGWRYFPQRLPLFGIAGLILAGAAAIGHLILRLLRPVWPNPGWELTVLACALGLSALSLLTLGCGLAGWLSRTLLGGILILAILAEVVFRLRTPSPDYPRNGLSETRGVAAGLARVQTHFPPASEVSATSATSQRIIRASVLRQTWAAWQARLPWTPAAWLTVLACLPFALCFLLGAVLPEIDFDVKEYHFEGPKEWYQAGRIEFLPHNVYTNFPFLTEMLTLAGMVLDGDWYWGALAGKAVLAAFAPLTALGLYAAGRRWFSPAAGLFAAGIHLTTPWIYRISTTAYAEGGLTFYLFATCLAVMLGIERLGFERPATAAQQPAPFARPRDMWRLFLVAGMLAGSGFACKYPGLLSVVLPAVVATCAAPFVVRRPVGWAMPTNGADRARANAATTATPAVGTAHPTVVPTNSADPGRTETATSASMVGTAHPTACACINLAALAVGIALTAGPWLLKNTVQTGNPVYPLLYSVFGGSDSQPVRRAGGVNPLILDRETYRDAELDARWTRAHRPDGYSPLDLVRRFLDVVAGNDWLSPLVFGFAPLALLFPGGRRRAGWLWLYVGYLFLTWWLFTHRIDRFWIPLLPVAALLAGSGAASLSFLDRRWLWGSAVVALLVAPYNLLVMTHLSGYNRFLLDLPTARAHTAELTVPSLEYLNQRLPPGSRVLCVGDAQVFDARFPVVYNTVFDRSIFEQWTASAQPGQPASAWPLRPAAEIRQALAQAGVTHVLVNWQEVLRYRTTYGFTPFVRPERFAELQALGILGEPWETPVYIPLKSVDAAQQAELTNWGASLLVKRPSASGTLEPAFPAFQVYRVRAPL